MLENIVQLGDIILKSSSFLDGMISEVEPLTKKGEQRYVCKFMFDTSKEELSFDLNEEISTDTTKKYRFVGSVGGPNTAQWCTTVKTVESFLTETIPTLLNQEIPLQLKGKLQTILDNTFIHIEGTDGKYKYFLNTQKTRMGQSIEQIFNELKKKDKVKTNKEVQKKVRAETGRIIDAYIKDKYGVKKDLIGLYVLIIDGECISCKDYYADMLEKAIRPTTEDVEGSRKAGALRNKSAQGKCGLCGSDEEIDFNLVKAKIKYYITDKISFASNVNKKLFYRNFGLCAPCYQKLQAGEVYVKNNLKTRLSHFDVYVIPHLIIETHMDKQRLDRCAEKLKTAVRRMCSFDEVISFRDEIFNINIEDDPYLVDFVFFEASNQATKIKKVIKDLQPSIFDDIQNNLNEVNDEFKNYYGKYRFNMESFFHLIPSIKGSSGKYSARYKQLLEWYSAIFTGRNVEIRSIVENSTNKARQLMVKDEEIDVINTIIKANMAIAFLRKSRCIRKNIVKEVEGMMIELKSGVESFLEKAGYDDEKTGLFLLGSLLAEIAYAQYKRNDKKTILNKLNYWGMDKMKVISLANEVFNKLRQEKILQYNEQLYGECMRLIGQSPLNLPKKEMLFYILTGYSVTTMCNIKEAQENKNQNQNEKLSEGVVSND